MKHEITIGEKYGPAMEITDEEEARAYFEECVQHMMGHGHDRAEAERIERQNLGYYAGYYNAETRSQVERLFRCAHPVFGRVTEQGQPTADEALGRGMEAGS